MQCSIVNTEGTDVKYYVMNKRKENNPKASTRN